ncbi:MAG: OsmC family protein [Anaerolineae bacterium]|nr:OsmC family protein [Anaerolineae bacterium]
MTSAEITLKDGFKAEAFLGNHLIIADQSVADGGSDEGPTPKQYLVAALGTCTAVTVKMYAQRKGWPLEAVDVQVSVESFKALDYPDYKGDADVVNEYRQVVTFKGDLTEEQRLRLLEIAGKCPVHRILMQPSIMIETMAGSEAAMPPEE